MKNDGLEVQDMLRERIELLGGYTHELVDTRKARNVVENQPSDFMACLPTRPRLYYAECKGSQSLTSFPWVNALRPTQHSHAHQVSVFDPLNYVVHIYAGKDRLWRDVPYLVGKEILKELKGSKSIPWVYLDPFINLLEKERDGL